ncbi:cytochrome P450 [Saccharopolyspora sp. TS4A08]|uniref:Cytochrome P450 n=1 Tax=Saccharopolyspora ipomoeae TaxID=3042027 RepID=A0ABT6PN60_9PSEU|nr:cytochrome P450 [Saccharopolyspora sp. TS4A08]MDI2029347.1 cytochrome P450 [Saccharopolyspora sp. TS4A08]
MTNTLSSADAAEIPDYPMTRASGCPFDPPPRLKALQEETPIHRVRLADGTTPWLVTRYADQRAVLADPRISSDSDNPGYPRGVPAQPGGSKISFILMDDPEHARQRRMVTAPFTVKRVEAMRPAVQKIVDDRIDEMLAGPKPVDLVQAFALPVPSLVICELLGVPYADHDFFQDNSKTIINRDSTPEQRAGALANLTRYLDDLVGRKLETPADDLLSGLCERVEAGELERADVAQMGVLLLIAGHETTANMIALGTLALLENPDQLALLRETDDPKVVAGAVEEMLRYLHITHNGRRRVALEDIEVGGQVIRAGEGVILPNGIGNRDPEVFDDPDALDLTRDARKHVAFGFGVHQCLGQPLARMELQVVYSTLYKRIPTLRAAAELDEIPFKHNGSVYGVYELPVTW